MSHMPQNLLGPETILEWSNFEVVFLRIGGKDPSLFSAVSGELWGGQLYSKFQFASFSLSRDIHGNRSQVTAFPDPL